MKKSIFNIRDNLKTHLIFIFCGCSILYFVSSWLDIFERLYSFIERNEKFNVDEILLIGFFMAIYFFIWAYISNISIRKRNKKIEQISNELNRELETRTKFHTIIAHDLRAPFNSMIGLSDMLVKKPELLKTQKGIKIATAINSSCRAGYALLENLLEWSGIQSKAIKPNQKNVDYKKLISEEIKLLQGNLTAKKIKINKEFASNSKVYCDENMFRIIFRNLLSNAIKYSFTTSKIDLRTSDNNANVQFEIVDYGTGMSLEVIDSLFNGEFKSVPGTDNEIGTGLGLGICNEFIKLNGGQLIIESKLNEGARFKFMLPKSEHSY